MPPYGYIYDVRHYTTSFPTFIHCSLNSLPLHTSSPTSLAPPALPLTLHSNAGAVPSLAICLRRLQRLILQLTFVRLVNFSYSCCDTNITINWHNGEQTRMKAKREITCMIIHSYRVACKSRGYRDRLEMAQIQGWQNWQWKLMPECSASL
jgi:hypothetical protein